MSNPAVGVISDHDTVHRPRSKSIVFLSLESPWPAYSGGSLRTLGLLKELSRAYKIHLIVLSQQPLLEEQETKLNNYVRSLTRVPLLGATYVDKLRILALMFGHRMPYHCALIRHSFGHAPKILKRILAYSGVVYASYGHWGTLLRGNYAPNWILDQADADIEFWRVYASQASRPARKMAALLNWRLAAAHFPRIYSSVGRIVSVCEEDRQLTLAVAPQSQIDVVANGVDCSYFIPQREGRSGSPRLLFTGTPAPRNMTALKRFVKDVLPLIEAQKPDVELLVAGNFNSEAQAEFDGVANLHFTGWLEDMRPAFNQSDVFVAPFAETHGSKLKVAEAMAMSMPIVSTPQGIRGFSLKDGESVLVAHSDGHFAAQVVRLLNDNQTRDNLGTAARRLALAAVDWRILGERLRGIVKNHIAWLLD